MKKNMTTLSWKKKLTRIGAGLLAAAAVITSGAVSSTDVEAATITYRQNVSTSAVSANADKASLPTASTSLTAGGTYYFNMQVKTSVKLKKAELYIQEAGKSSYTKAASETAKNYFNYAYVKYTLNSSTGTLKYYWKLTSTDGTCGTTTKTSLSVKASSSSSSTSSSTKYSSKLNSFLKDSRWKAGISWKSSQKPKLSSYSSKGCAAYCADIVKYVYGKSSPRGGTHFTSVSKIQAGDVLVMKDSKGNSHWIFVYARSGNKLSVLEGNYLGKTANTTSRYTISGTKIKTSSTTYTLADGYHFE